MSMCACVKCLNAPASSPPSLPRPPARPPASYVNAQLVCKSDLYLILARPNSPVASTRDGPEVFKPVPRDALDTSLRVSGAPFSLKEADLLVRSWGAFIRGMRPLSMTRWVLQLC